MESALSRVGFKSIFALSYKTINQLINNVKISQKEQCRIITKEI